MGLGKFGSGLFALLVALPGYAMVDFAGSERQVDITINDLSLSQQDDFTHSLIRLCAEKSNTSVFLTFSEIPSTSGGFTVLPVGAGMDGQDYTLKLIPRESSQKVDPVVKQTAYPVLFKSGCNSDQHDAKLHLNFKKLGELPSGYYESLLQVEVSGQDKTIDIPIRITNGDQVQIKQLEDLVLTDTGSEWSASNPNICVYSSTGSYALEARSLYRGQLQNGQGAGGDYRIFWKAGTDREQEITDQLNSHGGELRSLSASLKPDCTASESAEVRITMSDTIAKKLPAGVYQDTVTLTVRAM